MSFMNQPKRLLAADILRGIAILMVVVYHAFGAIYGYFLPWKGWWRNFELPPTQTFMYFYPISFGWAGVALFFVLSGFCIHLSFLRSSSFSHRRFLWQRFWRVYPTYLIALIAFVYFIPSNLSPLSIQQILPHLLLLHNLDDKTFFGINPSFWSIATEFQFYLGFPLLLLFRKRWGIEGCLMITFAIGLVWRVFVIAQWGLPDHLISPAFASPLMSWFDWTLGAYVAERFTQSKTAFPRPLGWLLVLLPIFVCSNFCKPITAFSFTLAATIAAVVLDWALRVKFRTNTVFNGLAAIGLVSYSVYLWHQPFFSKLATRPSDLLGIAVLIAGLSSVSYWFLEKGSIRVGGQIWKRVTASRDDRATNNKP